jgi:hypothetical protein
MKRPINVLFFIFTLLNTLTAQGDLKIGQWRTYLPYQAGTYVTQSNSHVYWATGLSVLKMDKNDFSLEYMDKSNSLNDVGTRLVRYNKVNNNLMVVYRNSVIDLVKPSGSTKTLSDIFNNQSIIGDKIIYDVFFSGDSAYLACSFGIVKLDMKRNEFISTTFTKQRVFSIAVFNGQIYAATEGGIFSVKNDPRINVVDFKQWKQLGAADGFPPQYQSNVLSIFNEKLYFNVNDTLFTFQNGLPLSVFSRPTRNFKFLTAEGANLLVGTQCNVDCDAAVYVLDKNNQVSQIADNCNDRTLYGIEDEKGRTWFADQYPGFRFSSSTKTNCSTPTFNSPFFSTATDIAVTDTSVYVAAGGIEGINARLSPDGVTRLIKGKWVNINPFTHKILADSGAGVDFYRIAINKTTRKVYAGTYWGGLVEIVNDVPVKVYNDNNSALQGAIGDEQRERIGGLAYDKKGNLWISNSSAPSPIVVLKSDNKWVKMQPAPLGANTTLQLVIDSVGFKWLVVNGSQSGLLVFDEGKDIDNLSDDRMRFLDNGTLPTELQNARINCIAVDLDGRVWVGTSSGIAVYECGNDPFRATCRGRLVVSALDGIGEYLLKDKSVNYIAIDGANRKWFGTSVGIFVQSADGKDEVAKFNSENSPLLSNNITALGIRQSTGEVFIGSDRGLMSYRSDAITGFEFNKDTAYAYPNPVRPDYQGPIAIKGLARDANVKITDVNGTVVYETRSLGGQAIWDGRDFSGRRASTGVYLVFATNTRNLDAGDAVVAKILFIN